MMVIDSPNQVILKKIGEAIIPDKWIHKNGSDLKDLKKDIVLR